MKLSPHHVIDIFKVIGNGGDLSRPHPYGHAQHVIADELLKNLDIEIEFVCENDDICCPCKHLKPDNTCTDVLSQLEDPISKQLYNDELDQKIFAALDLEPGTIMAAKDFLKMVLLHLPALTPVVTHPGRDEQYTENGLKNAGERFLE